MADVTVPFDLAQLDALAAVVAEGSFDAAARRLHVTPSAVSQRIKALEQLVGHVLVQRSRPCRATVAGRRSCGSPARWSCSRPTRSVPCRAGAARRGWPSR
ncbi:LysR family transcriptional regulator [Cellulomonas soli]